MCGTKKMGPHFATFCEGHWKAGEAGRCKAGDIMEWPSNTIILDVVYRYTVTPSAMPLK